MAVAKALVPVTANTDIKARVDLKLELRRDINTLILTLIHLMYLMIHS